MSRGEHRGAPASDFELGELYAAIDAQRQARKLSWPAVAAEISERCARLRPIALSTIRGLRDRRVGEGDGILQMLIWLRRTPESFMRNVADPCSAQFVAPSLVRGEILRWDARALYDAMNARRRARELTWTATAREIAGFTPTMLTRMAKGGRVGFPHVMRLVRWLDRPAASF